MNTNPFVIFLNGASSAGKSTLAHALQDVAVIPFMHVGLDKLIGMMPHKYNDWNNSYTPSCIPQKEGFWFTSHNSIDQDLSYGPYAHTISYLLFDIVQTMLNQNINLIIDEVVIEQTRFDTWKHLLYPYKTIFVQITCQEDVLIEREKQRKNRMIGSALTQHKKIHINKKYDYIADTTNLDSYTIAHKILDTLFKKYQTTPSTPLQEKSLLNM